MAKFIQILEFETDSIDEIQKHVDEWRKATEGKRTSVRDLVGQDRGNAGRYYVIVEFPSYEEAMKNSELPETAALAEQQKKLTKGAPRFINLDVVHEGD